MTNQNAVDTNMTNNSDGGQIGMGITFARFLKWLGADVTIQGNGAAVVTFPTGTATLLSSQLGELGSLFGNATLGASDRGLAENSPNFTKSYFNMSQIFSDNVLVSNTYSPTLTTGTNIKGLTNSTWRYWKIGDWVFVMGSLSISVTTSGSLSNLHISLPIASNMNTSQDLLGMCNQVLSVFANPGLIFANTGTADAQYQFVPSNTSLQVYRAFFAFVVK